MLTLTPIETIALSKAVKDTEAKICRGKLTVGHHDVDFNVRVSGPLLVAPPGRPSKVKESVPEAVLLALVLENLATRTRKTILDRVSDDLAGWRSGDELPDVQPTAAEMAEQILAHGQRERDGTRSGNVTAPLTVELLARA